jgi:hypothetical protein
MTTKILKRKSYSPKILDYKIKKSRRRRRRFRE